MSKFFKPQMQTIRWTCCLCVQPLIEISLIISANVSGKKHRQIRRQTDRQTHTQTDRHTHRHRTHVQGYKSNTFQSNQSKPGQNNVRSLLSDHTKKRFFKKFITTHLRDN